MNGFQLFSTALSALFSLLVLIGLFKRRIALGSAIFWLTTWISAAVVILNPDWTRVVAEFAGIARGADLVFYCAILAMFIGFFLVYARLRKLDQTMTQIVRAIAINEATTDEAMSPERSSSTDGRNHRRDA